MARGLRRGGRKHRSVPSPSGAYVTVLTRVAGDNKLAVVLGTYQPSVRCSGTIAGWTSCPPILYSMEASSQPQVFGPPSAATRDVTLPAVINSGWSFPRLDNLGHFD